ncbi:MAG: TonB-dependent receptor [Pseudomonadota bacterium]
MFHKSTFLRTTAVACILSISPFAATFAQGAKEPIDEVVVRAHPLSAEKIAQPVAVLKDEELGRALAPSIAETLNELPGVHSSSFGQAVGRPVIRGLGGARVKTTEDRIDSLDVSVSSPDHVTTIEPFAAKSIEVLKGPATLLYGTGAIGGVVDVHTGRIPHEVPDQFGGKVQIRGADNASRQTAAASFDGGSGNFAFHLDAFYRDADEYDIPGFAESAALRELEELEEEEHEGEEEEEGHDEEEEAFGVLPGSQLRTTGAAFGVSRVSDRGFFGIAVSRYEADYGLPGHGHEEEGHDEEEGEEEEGHDEEEEGNPLLDLAQTRIDLEAGVNAPFAGFKTFNFRVGYNDYEHTEFEGNGEAGTVFATEALEGRVELLHEQAAGFDGAMGIQFSTREFSALGEEAFVQPVDTQTFGIFYVGQRDFGNTGFEIGARYEHVEHEPTVGASRSFDLGAISFGLIQPLSDSWTLSGQLDYSNRAPVAEELFSDGPHLATNSFEIGDPNLDEESAVNVSAALAYQQESFDFAINAYYTDFSDFIYEVATGEEEDGLPILEWRQEDAEFRGVEVDFGWNAAEWSGGGMRWDLGFDLVRASLDNGFNRNVPRIPPRRYRIGTLMTWDNFSAEVVWRRIESQRRFGAEELPTDGYNDLRIHLAYAMDFGDNNLELFLTGRNLTDDEQRYHTSFIKDLAPQPGRTIEAGVTWSL